MDKKSNRVYDKIFRLAGDAFNGHERTPKHLLRALNKVEGELKRSRINHIETTKRINNILKVIEAYARLDLQKKAPVGRSGNHFDALATGINMLGEELQSSTVSLNEKVVLLKEVHHRVKNNLQIISSLLRLQADQIGDKKLASIFCDNQRRIQSMALVHETLYRSKNISKVNFANYLEILVRSAKGAYTDVRKIQFQIEAESHELRIDIAIPCGLIINELVTNSFKYAFNGRTKGKIQLKFGREVSKGKGFYKLTVSDNGVGLPKNFNINNSGALGLQLVSLLIEQLGGKLLVKSNNGTSFSIVFPSMIIMYP